VSSDAGPANDGPTPARPDYRYSLANERTFLSWTRTGLALIAGGVAVEQFATFGQSWIVAVVGLAGIALGASAAAWALVHFGLVQRAIDRDEPLPKQPAAPLITVGIVVVAVLLVIGIVVG